MPPRQSVVPVIPEDVIERAARAWDSDFESCTSTLRAEALEDASRALTASGLPARVAELERENARLGIQLERWRDVVYVDSADVTARARREGIDTAFLQEFYAVARCPACQAVTEAGKPTNCTECPCRIAAALNAKGAPDACR